MFRPVFFLLFSAVVLCANAAPAAEGAAEAVEPAKTSVESAEGVAGDSKKDTSDLEAEASHHVYASLYNYPRTSWSYVRNWNVAPYAWGARFYNNWGPHIVY